MPQRTETRPLRLEIASTEDAAELAVVAALAFYDDRKRMPKPTRVGLLAADDPAKGPPHTSYEWLRRVLRNVNERQEDTQAAYYKAILGDSRIVGGLFVVPCPDLGNGEWRCEGIYVDPDYQNRGIGQNMLRAMFRLHPDVDRWSLGTPEYAVGNHHFYERMGFTRTGTSDGDPAVPFRFYNYENALPQEERIKL